MNTARMLVVAWVGSLGLVATTSGQSPVPSYGHNFIPIGDPGNAPYGGGSFGHTEGRGRVDYTYRIARTEITTAQWMEYANTFSTLPGNAFFTSPTHWGAQTDPTYGGPGRRWRAKNVKNWDMLPVAGISWQEAARYANWLHNGQSSDPASLETGAYDTSTWGVDPKTGFRTDGPRLPGAKYWIPSLEEWLKAVHYDPDRNGPGDGGWWLYPNESDDPLKPGRPGQGQTMGGVQEPGFGQWDVPLEAYPEVASPWGLLDASGGAKELLEEWAHPERPREHFLNGSNAGSSGWVYSDRADFLPGSLDPTIELAGSGFRIAAAVPSSGTAAIGFVVVSMFIQRRRRSFSTLG